MIVIRKTTRISCILCPFILCEITVYDYEILSFVDVSIRQFCIEFLLHYSMMEKGKRDFNGELCEVFCFLTILTNRQKIMEIQTEYSFQMQVARFLKINRCYYNLISKRCKLQVLIVYYSPVGVLIISFFDSCLFHLFSLSRTPHYIRYYSSYF